MPWVMAVFRDRKFQANELVRVQCIPAAEALETHLLPERAFAEMDAAAAKVIFLQASLPQVAQPAGCDETRQLSDQQGKDGASGPAGAADIGHVRDRRRRIRAERPGGDLGSRCSARSDPFRPRKWGAARGH